MSDCDDVSLSGRTRWTRLVEWLRTHAMDVDALTVQRRQSPGAGHGLFAVRDCPPSAPLFTVPASALINLHTLTPLHPNKGRKLQLIAFQLIALHLFLHRPIAPSHSADPHFGPYIDILPRDFSAHPLSSLVLPKSRTDSDLVASLPPSVRTALAALLSRFNADWRRVQLYLIDDPNPPTSSPRPSLALTDLQARLPDFLWAWLNVNTRCIFLRLKPALADPDNLTLAPILDFANHRPVPHAHPLSDVSPAFLSPSNLKKSRGFTLVAPSDRALRQGEQVFLRYGAHPNRKLFVEYGFVNDSGEADAEVDVQDVLETLFESCGELGAGMKRVLDEEGYWGDWTLHMPREQEQPAHPSYRLVTALRLYALVPLSSAPALSDDLIQPWRDTLLGRRTVVSRANETAWRGTLLEICALIARRADEGLRALDLVDGGPDYDWMKDNVRKLWLEERMVADAVGESVRRGEEF